MLSVLHQPSKILLAASLPKNCDFYLLLQLGLFFFHQAKHMKKISGNVVILLDKISDTIESSNEKGTANSLTSTKRTEPKKSFVILSPLKTLLIFHHQWCFVCKKSSCKVLKLDVSLLWNRNRNIIFIIVLNSSILLWNPFSGSFHLNLICF